MNWTATFFFHIIFIILSSSLSVVSQPTRKFGKLRGWFVPPILTNQYTIRVCCFKLIRSFVFAYFCNGLLTQTFIFRELGRPVNYWTGFVSRLKCKFAVRKLFFDMSKLISKTSSMNLRNECFNVEILKQASFLKLFDSKIPS